MISRKLAALVLFIVAFSTSPLFAESHEIQLSAAPTWVNPTPVNVPQTLPHDSIEDGTYFLLTDRQIRVRENKAPEFYNHYAKLIVNQRGLESASQISIIFDPAYEKVTLHSLNVRRDNQLLDKAQSAKLSIIQRETDLENSIIDGRLTANYILDDIRNGDIIEYSYSKTGSNPIYQGLFAHSKYIQWSVPVHQQSLRLLWGKKTPLNIVKLNTAVYIPQQQHETYTEYSYSITDQDVLTTNSETPEWYDPYAQIIFSETSNWNQVVSWALPLYQRAIDDSPEVKEIASSIAKNYTDPSQRIVQALKFVQSEVRYFGIELGVSSHQPATAAETLKRRYGDCKDKAVLFISILKQLGIEAKPALVNTEITRELAKYPAMVNAFDHVIVKVVHNNEALWLDPTRQFQQGKLSDIYQPNYYHALVIDSATQNLERMNDIPDKSWLITQDHFDLTSGAEHPAQLQTSTEYTGLEAERQFSNFHTDGINSLQKDYIEYYQDYYGAIKTSKKLSIQENIEEGKITTSEDYQLLEFWEKNTDKNKYFADFYADSIRGHLPRPEQENRNAPFSIDYPKNIKQTITVQFPTQGWTFDDEQLSEENPFFNFSYSAKYNAKNQILRLNYQLNLLTGDIREEDIKSYLEARSKVFKVARYGIQKSIISDSASSAEETTDYYQLTIDIYIVLLISGLAFSIIDWRKESRKNSAAEESIFYPVSLAKFMALNIVTFGIYNVYWFYRNWLYVKSENESHIMPVIRGIFNNFWYYPLYQELVKDSEARYQENKVLSRPLAVLFALAFFSALVLSYQDNLLIPVMILEPLLVLPLLNYINHIKQNQQQAYSNNSRWMLRHSIVSALFTPYLLYLFATSVYLLPSGSIVEGKQLWVHDIKFMQRQNLFPVDEKLIYFYSDAMFNMRDDGNGFTRSHVFSYWKDDNNRLNFESARFSEVKNIKATYSQTRSEISSVTITRKDDSEFILYISSENGKDKQFVETLKTQWRLSK